MFNRRRLRRGSVAAGCSTTHAHSLQPPLGRNNQKSVLRGGGFFPSMEQAGGDPAGPPLLLSTPSCRSVTWRRQGVAHVGPRASIHAAKLRREGRGRPIWAHLLVSKPLDRPLARRWQGETHLGPPAIYPN